MRVRFQVLGLSNYSRDAEAGMLRKCIRDDVATARLAVDYAKERLRTFMHVGTFEGMREHLSAFASKMGIDIDQKAYSSNKQHAFSYDSDPEDAEKVHPSIHQHAPLATHLRRSPVRLAAIHRAPEHHAPASVAHLAEYRKCSTYMCSTDMCRTDMSSKGMWHLHRQECRREG